MPQLSFQEILENQLNKVSPSSGTISEPAASGLDPAGLSFLLGQVGRFQFNTKAHYKATQAPRPTPKARRPAGQAHSLNDLQNTSFQYFQTSTQPLAVDFTHKELKKAFRLLALNLHPDRGGNPQQFIELKKHFDNLTTVFTKV